MMHLDPKYIIFKSKTILHKEPSGADPGSNPAWDRLIMIMAYVMEMLVVIIPNCCPMANITIGFHHRKKAKDGESIATGH